MEDKNMLGQQKNTEASYYSRFRVKSEETNMTLSATFWSGTLKLSITENRSTENTKPNELAAIYMSPFKSAIMAEYISKVIEDENCKKIYGVNTGAGESQGLFLISRENKVPYIIIAKVDSNGKFVNSQRFNFNRDYNYGLEVTNLDTLDFNKEYKNHIELSALRDLLLDFSRSANGAYAYFTHDINRYEIGKIVGKINKIAEKVGVESNSGSYSKGNSNNSYFNKSDKTKNKQNLEDDMMEESVEDDFIF